MCSLKWTFRSSSSAAFAKIQTTTKLVVWYHSYLPQPNRCLTTKSKNSPKRNFLLLHCPLQVIPCLMEHGLLLGKPRKNHCNIMQLNWAHNNHMQVRHIKITEQRALFYTTFVMHSQLLEGLKCESKWKTAEEGGVGTRSLAHNTWGVEGCVGAPGWD
jgi:hypothetical protein